LISFYLFFTVPLGMRGFPTIPPTFVFPWTGWFDYANAIKHGLDRRVPLLFNSNPRQR
jgi:hypothetical protein